MYYQKENISIDEILTKNYYYCFGSGFCKDCNSLFTGLYSKNKTLSSQQVDSLIKKMVKGRTKSSLIRYDENLEVLDLLTKKHLLTEKQVTAILNCLKPAQNLKWIDNLIKLGYQLTDKQIDKLVTLGYEQGIDLILKRDQSNIEELNKICETTPLNLEQMESFLIKFKVIPTIETINIIKNSYVDLELESVVKLLIKYQLPVCIQVVEELYKYINLNKISEYIDELFKTKINDLSDIVFIFSSGSHIDNAMDNVLYLITKCKQYEINLDHKYLKLLMTHIKKSGDYKTQHEPSTININTYHYAYIYSFRTVSISYYEIINIFITQDLTSQDLLGLLEHACYISDRLVFDILINKSKEFSEKCVLNACESCSIDMLKILFNMKALPTLECVKSLKNNGLNNDIFDLLLVNGLPVNDETIEAALTKGLYIENLENYGYKVDLNLYKICYKYNNFPTVYIKQLENNQFVNLDIRLAISDYFNLHSGKTEDEIINLIKIRNIIPDYMMYGHAVVNRKDKLVEYFENEWGLKPNLDTLVLINDFQFRREYLQRIIDCHNIKQDIITTVAEPAKQAEIETVKSDRINNPNENVKIVKESKNSSKG